MGERRDSFLLHFGFFKTWEGDPIMYYKDLYTEYPNTLQLTDNSYKKSQQIKCIKELGYFLTSLYIHRMRMKELTIR
jgi:hypothetical protein